MPPCAATVWLRVGNNTSIISIGDTSTETGCHPTTKIGEHHLSLLWLLCCCFLYFLFPELRGFLLLLLLFLLLFLSCCYCCCCCCCCLAVLYRIAQYVVRTCCYWNSSDPYAAFSSRRYNILRRSCFPSASPIFQSLLFFEIACWMSTCRRFV